MQMYYFKKKLYKSCKWIWFWWE